MAKKPMVTRTITTTRANVLCVDVEQGEPFNQSVVVPRTYKDEKSLMKAVKSQIETDTIKAVHVVDTEVLETLYGMDEQDFIAHAMVLSPRSTNGSET